MTDLPIKHVAITVVRVPSRLADTEIASPMDAFPEHRRRRASWYGSMESVVLEITAEDITGVAVTQGGHAVAAILARHLGPGLIGKNADDIEDLWEFCRRATLPYGTDGLASMARSAIDLALWDLRGRAHSLPIYALLGARPRDLTVYASGNDVEDHRRLGFTASKWGIDIGPWSQDSVHEGGAQLRLARQRTGNDRDLMVDAWMGWTRDFALEMAPLLEELRVEWLEEPLPPDAPTRDLEAIACALGRTRLATGEHAYSLREFRRLVDSGVTVLQPDLAWCGGLTAGLRIAELASSSGVELAPHLGGAPWGLHLATASRAAERAEWYVGSAPGTGLDTEPSVLQHRQFPTNGLIKANDGSGFGVDIDATALASYRADPTVHVAADS